MGNKCIVILNSIFVVIFIVAYVSNAEFLGNSRRLAASSSPQEHPNISPKPSPVDGNDKGGNITASTNKQVDESCDGIQSRCQDDNSMVACIKTFNAVSKAVVLLIQNKGEDSLKVYLTFSSSGNQPEPMEIPKLQTEQVGYALLML